MATHQFQTEVSKLLHLIIHSLYSNKEIFLRELVSNASDALDKLKYLSLTDDSLKGLKFEPRVDISFDKEKKTLVISDNGIGMNDKELEDNLGTIARSGTKAFLEKLADNAKKDSNLIGQFGVGFYSAFMVAEKIDVLSRRAGEEGAWLWSSDGKEGYELEASSKDASGTVVTLHLNDEGLEFADRWRLQDIVKRYSDHVAFPIFLHYVDTKWDEKEKKSVPTGEKEEQVNAASALWKRSKSELQEKDYFEFYKAIGHDDEDPLHYVHTKAEGSLEYTTLFYIPSKAPFDLYRADYQAGVKLYVRRVFITDDEKELLPTYLRFVRGVIDSEDLPLNVSREILQQNKILVNIRSASVKKILGEIKELSVGNKEKFQKFVAEFNKPMKEGLITDYANRELILDIVRFKSSSVDGWVSLAEYKDRMQADQKAIYYIAGGAEEALRKSPLLEMYKKKGIEVLVMGDDVDEIIAPSIGKFGDFDLKPVNRADTSEDFKTEEDKSREKDMKPVAEKVKKALGDKVKDVRLSSRLTDSPACIVADGDEPSQQLRKLMEAMGQKGDLPEVKPILEINPTHPLIERIRDSEDEAYVGDLSAILLDQALLVEGLSVGDPAGFVKRMNILLSR